MPTSLSISFLPPTGGPSRLNTSNILTSELGCANRATAIMVLKNKLDSTNDNGFYFAENGLDAILRWWCETNTLHVKLNSHFSSLSLKPCLSRRQEISFRACTWLSLFMLLTKMSSMYQVTPWILRSMASNVIWTMAGTKATPNGNQV